MLSSLEQITPIISFQEIILWLPGVQFCFDLKFEHLIYPTL